SFFDRQVLSVLAPPIIADLRMNDVSYSWVVFAFLLSYSVMFTVGGWMIDRLGTRLGMALSVGIWSLASLLHAVANSAFGLGAFRFLLGVGEGGCFPGAAKAVLEWFPKKERAMAMGFATAGGSAIGAVLAPPVIVWASIHIGWRGAFLVTGFLGACWLVFWLLTYSRPENSRFLSGEERRHIEQDGREQAQGDVQRGLSNPIKAWGGLLKLREVQGLVIARFLFDPVFYLYMFWIPRYLNQERGASLERIGQLTWIPFLTLGISSVLGGWVSDRLVARGLSINKARKTMLVASALLTPVSILSVFVSDAETAVFLMSVLMFAHGFWITNYMTMIGDMFPGRVVATVVGLTGTAGGIGGFLTSPLIGRIVQNFSFAPVFIAAGLIYPISALIILALVREIKRLDAAAPRLQVHSGV
ncbi:MAG: MFS transporter, partial [Bryobacteraceae bacterium]